jgi:hypothetical protein
VVVAAELLRPRDPLRLFTIQQLSTGSAAQFSLLFLRGGSVCFVLFITRSGRPALASVPDTINCRILISEYVHTLFPHDVDTTGRICLPFCVYS